MIYVAKHADDEVTSVVDTTAVGKSPTTAPGEADSEDQVTHTSVRSDLPARSRRNVHDPNVPANDDQADRAFSITRGNRTAIARARERHAQRRTPTRPMIAPEPPTEPTSGDRVITSRDRQQYDQSTRNERPTPPGGAGNGADATPPVPREEVQAQSAGLSPAVGPDRRFDSVPEIKADIELPRLRQFLHGSPAGNPQEPGSGTPLPDVSISSYDLVLRRAREIKAQASAAPAARPPARPELEQARPQAPRPADDQPTADAISGRVAPVEPEVVWDLDPGDLKVAFRRVREAISQPLPTRREPVRQQVAGPNALEGDDLDVWPGDDRGHAAADFDGALEPLADPYGDENVASSYFRDPEPESPRLSWWRSLNFGRRRRISVDPAPAPPPAYDEPVTNQVWDYESWDHDYDGITGTPDETPATWDSDEGPAAGWHEPERQHVATGDPRADDRSYGEEHFVTSEESWREDEVEFPEPQPAAWHETRAALLAGSRFETEPDDMMPAAAERRDTERATPTLPVSGSTSPEARREPPPFFAIDQPGGMSAFRAALFGDDASELDREPDIGFDTASPSALRSLPPAPPAPGPVPSGRAFNEAPRERAGRRPDAPARPWQHLDLATGTEFKDAILDQEDVERRYEVASSVPKCCRTCRSFRPSEHRDRGWCSNDDAFTHRQMVNADSLSCRSSIGDWWLAADQSWIPPDDMIRPETPRTDRLLAQRDSQDEPSRRDGRRVRTRKAV